MPIAAAGQPQNVTLSPLRTSSARGDRAPRKVSVQTKIHEAINKAEAAFELEIAEGIADEIKEEEERLDCDSICTEVGRLDAFEQELRKDLFDAEAEWKVSERSGHNVLLDNNNEDDDDDYYNHSNNERLDDELLHDKLKSNENDETEFASESDDDSHDGNSVTMRQESDVVQQEALSAATHQTSLLSFALAADALTSRLYQGMTADARILPAYLQRQLYMTKPQQHQEPQEQEGQDEASPSSQSQIQVWQYGVPLLGSVSVTGKMMLFLRHVMEDFEELD
ncbi:hypothetical protein ACA910_017117 [Epithemia clementina (nom. ined.)]